MVSVTIKIEATTAEVYMRYQGKAVDEALAAQFWNVQEENEIGVASRSFTHTQTVNLAEGPHYVIYGNSASGAFWHSKIFINGVLKGEGDVNRGAFLRADFTVGAEPPGPEPGDRVFEETYRGIDIYYEEYADMYYYTVDGVEHYQPTLGQAHTHIDTLLEPEPEPPEFKFAAYTPFVDTREIFPVGAPWPSVTKSYAGGEDVYAHYAAKNNGA